MVEADVNAMFVSLVERKSGRSHIAVHIEIICGSQNGEGGRVMSLDMESEKREKRSLLPLDSLLGPHNVAWEFAHLLLP